MVDRGISENFVTLWLEIVESDVDLLRHVESRLGAAAVIARYGAGGASLIELYERACRYFDCPILAAEFFRRALLQLAEGLPVDDSLPPPGSPVWEQVVDELRQVTLISTQPTPPRPPASRRGSWR